MIGTQNIHSTIHYGQQVEGSHCMVMVMVSGGSRIFLRRGCQLSRGVPTYEFAKFSQKLHEIERIWTRGGDIQHFTM